MSGDGIALLDGRISADIEVSHFMPSIRWEEAVELWKNRDRVIYVCVSANVAIIGFE